MPRGAGPIRQRKVVAPRLRDRNTGVENFPDELFVRLCNCETRIYDQEHGLLRLIS